MSKSDIFKYMWYVIRTTKISDKSVALKLAWAKSREKQEGLLDNYKGYKLKTNGLTGQNTTSDVTGICTLVTERTE